jgi:hypothetical protein
MQMIQRKAKETIRTMKVKQGKKLEDRRKLKKKQAMKNAQCAMPK